MLELDETTAEQLRSIDIFDGHMPKERGKSRRSPTFNYKKASISRAKWCDKLAEDRCSTIKAKAARLWLYENSMTYRKYYDLHRSILNDFTSTHPCRRMELYEPTHSLLLKLPDIEVAAWPILYPWCRYGDTDVQERISDGGSGKLSSHYSGKQSFIRKLMSLSDLSASAIPFFLFTRSLLG